MKRKLLLALWAVSMMLCVEAQVTKIITGITAGTLSTLLTVDEKANVTDLTLSGNLDARDFVTIRDEMLSLINLDISGVSIQAYSGSDGTYPFLTTYPAAELPQFSFNNNTTNSGKTTINSINLPDMITSIGFFAFSQCSGLTGITIPGSVTHIDSYAFSDCTGLSAVTIPNSVNSSGIGTFSGCSGLTSVTIGTGLSSLGSNIFSDCSKLSVVDIPSTITSIGDAAFYSCSALSSVTIPNSVTSIGSSAFAECVNLDSINIPNSVITIGNSVCYGCTVLTSITLGTGLTTIADGAFWACTALKIIYSLKTTPATIGDSSFGDGITDVFVTKLAAVTAYKANAGWISYFPGNIIKKFIPLAINKTITNMVAGTLSTILTFDEKTTVTNLTLSGFIDASDLKCMRDEMTKLTSINIAATTVQEYNGANGTSVLRSHYTANEIPEQAFFNSTLSSIILPNGVTSITDYAFFGCSELTSISTANGLTSIGNESFGNCTALASISIPAGVNSIGASAFDGCNTITGLTIPNGVTSIENRTFYGCRALSNIVIPSGVTKIGDYAFGECNNLTTVSIPNSVTSLGLWSFGYCQNLASITIPNGLTSIPDGSFYDCYGLTSLSIPDKVTSIGLHAFAFCSGLTNLSLGKEVTTIGDEAFNGCSGLITIHSLNANHPSIGNSCFSGLSLLTDVYVPTSDAVIDYKANADWIGFFPGDIIKAETVTTTNPMETSKIKIYPGLKVLIVEGVLAGGIVRVYSLNGTLLQSVQFKTGKQMVINESNKGMYLVKTGSETYKVIL